MSYRTNLRDLSRAARDGAIANAQREPSAPDLSQLERELLAACRLAQDYLIATGNGGLPTEQKISAAVAKAEARHD